MKEVIDCGLPVLAQPFSWVVRGGGILFTTHGPVRQDGSIDTGTIEDQARLTFSNLRRAVEAAGGTLADVTQVLIYMLDIGDMQTIDAVYRVDQMTEKQMLLTYLPMNEPVVAAWSDGP